MVALTCGALSAHHSFAMFDMDKNVTLEGTVDRHRPPPPHNRRAPYLVYASDDTGDVAADHYHRYLDDVATRELAAVLRLPAAAGTG